MGAVGSVPVMGVMVGVWLVGGTGGCRTRPKATDDPVRAVKRFMAAVESGDAEAVFKHLGPRTRQRLERNARLASAQTVGTVKLKAVDMLSVGARAGAQARWTPKTFRVVEKSQKKAVVEVAASKPPHVLLDAGRLKIVVTAGTARSVRPSVEDGRKVHAAWPVVGLAGVGCLFPAGSEGRLVVGFKERVHLVRGRGGGWRVELSWKDD